MGSFHDFVAFMKDFVSGGECYYNVTSAVAEMAPCPSEAYAASLREPFQSASSLTGAFVARMIMIEPSGVSFVFEGISDSPYLLKGNSS